MAADNEARPAKLLSLSAAGEIRHSAREDLPTLIRSGDLVVANDAATLPASLSGRHAATGEPVELRLAGWITPGDPTRFVAVAFAAGDWHTRTEDRLPSPRLNPGDMLALGPLLATVERVLGHPRLVALRLAGKPGAIWAGIAAHGRPIQYSHAAEPYALWDVWTKVAAHPIAFEPPSAGFALDWRMLAAFRERGIGFATLTHAAGISSTGDPSLDARLPLDEPFHIPEKSAARIARAKIRGGRVIAIGTTVVRALEAAAEGMCSVRAGNGVATGRIGPRSRLKIVDAIVSGVHAPGESHFELLAAFTNEDSLSALANAGITHGYRNHEFGDSVLIERMPTRASTRTSFCHPLGGDRAAELAMAL